MVENINQITFNDNNKPWKAPHYPFSLEGHWQPWYDDRRDYNTNAPTYYDYLSNFNHLIKSITELLNRVARRNIEVEDTNCIDLTKINDWIDEGNACHTWHDDIILKADVILSTYQKAINFDGKDYKLLNAISCLNTGLYASDYLPLIQALADKLNQTIADNNDKFDDLQNQINQINQEITNIKNNINNIKGDINNIKGDINNINNRIDGLSSLVSATIQPPLHVVTMTPTSKLVDNGQNPPNKRVGIDYSNLTVEYEKGKHRRYEFFKVGISGYNFNNVTKSDNILARANIQDMLNAGISKELIYQAYVYGWGMQTGYTLIGTFNQLKFVIKATTNPYNDTSGELLIKLENWSSGTQSISGQPFEDNTNHVIIDTYDLD